MSQNIFQEDRERSFGETIAEVLALQGMRQVDLADALGTGQATVSSWIHGKAEPSPETVFWAERVLKMAPGALSRHLGYLPLEALDGQIDAEDAIRRSPDLDSDGRKLVLVTYRTMAAMKARTVQVVPELNDSTKAAKAVKAVNPVKKAGKKAASSTFQAAPRPRTRQTR